MKDHAYVPCPTITCDRCADAPSIVAGIAREADGRLDLCHHMSGELLDVRCAAPRSEHNSVFCRLTEEVS